MELDRFVVHFAGATGRLESSVETRVQVPSEPALGRMTGDPLDSIALPLGELSVYNGAKDRTIEPKEGVPTLVTLHSAS